MKICNLDFREEIVLHQIFRATTCMGHCRWGDGFVDLTWSHFKKVKIMEFIMITTH